MATELCYLTSIYHKWQTACWVILRSKKRGVEESEFLMCSDTKITERKGWRKKSCIKKWEERRTWSKGGAQKIKMLHWSCTSLVSTQWEAGEYHAVKKSHCQLPAEIDPPTFCDTSLSFLFPHEAAKTFLCKEAQCRHEQVSVVPVWNHEVRAVTGSGRRGLVAQQRERVASLQWGTSWSAGRPAQLHLSFTSSTHWESW